MTLILAAAVLATVAAPRTITVGGPGADFPLIAPAIAAARPGDRIVVRAGVYREDLLLDRPVAILGEGYPVLFGTGQGSVIRITAPGCEVRGLIVEGTGTGATNAMDAAIQIESDGNRITRNRMRRVFYGIVIAGASHNEVTGNEIAGFHDLPYGQRGDGIYLYRAPDNLVRDNHVVGQRDGIYFQYAPRSQAVGNLVERSRYGLHDMFSDEARIAGNVFRGCSVGANIMNGRRIVLQDNRIEENRGVTGVGLSIKDCDGSTIERNAIVGNPRGVQVDGSSTNAFRGNRFTWNGVALYLFASAEQNVFAGNDFDENVTDLIVSGRESGNRWTEDRRGNRWSRYAGYDFDGDGVGDLPHPLLQPFEKLEGRNPAVRLFLRSPAAAALELAGRFDAAGSTDPIDAAPLVAPAPAPAQPDAPALDAWRLAAALAIGLALVAMANRLLQEVRPCSR
jgi:nitrous oxidase accessory protein